MNISRKLAVAVCIIALVVSVVGLGYLGSQHIYLSQQTHGIQDFFASVFFVPSVTVPGLQAKYNNNQKIKILIVPGHEPTFGGTEFGGVAERDIAVDIAELVAANLRKDNHFEVVLSRSKANWSPELEKYFTEHWEDIKTFTQGKKAEMNRLVGEGKVVRATEDIQHGTAPSNVATRLYGINKWANENNVDITIHLHFNDYPRSRPSQAGSYRGFTIYIPDYQYSNAGASQTMASRVFDRLSHVAIVSTLPKEDKGIVGDQDLIAIGSSNTSDGVSMLIELGYIYEPQFSTLGNRNYVFPILADETSKGITDFFTLR